METEINLFGKESKIKFSKWYKNLTIVDKRLIFGFIGIFAIILLFNLSISTIRTYSSDLTVQECDQLRINDVRYFAELVEENNILAFIYAFSFPFKLLIGAIAISWVLHGVGFRVVG